MVIAQGTEVLAEDMLNLRMFPVGTILMYDGSFVNDTTMKGWYICNGKSTPYGTTPNLVDTFVRGGDNNTAKNPGGSNTQSITLNSTNMPAHSHTASGKTSYTGLTGSFGWAAESSGRLTSNGIVTIGASGSYYGSGDSDNDNFNFYIDARHDHAVSGTVDSCGHVYPAPVVLNITPEHYKMVYIIRMA